MKNTILARMRTLSSTEINDALQIIKTFSDSKLNELLDQFENEFPEIYYSIYGELSDRIGIYNLSMGDLFLDLCFDIFYIYSHYFGTPPKISNIKEWMDSKLRLINAELQSTSEEFEMEDKFREKLQNKFVDRVKKINLQMQLLAHMNNAVEKYVVFDRNRNAALPITENFLYVVVRLFDEIYHSDAENS